MSHSHQMVAGLVEGNVTVVADAQQLQVGYAALGRKERSDKETPFQALPDA